MVLSIIFENIVYMVIGSAHMTDIDAATSLDPSVAKFFCIVLKTVFLHIP